MDNVLQAGQPQFAGSSATDSKEPDLSSYTKTAEEYCNELLNRAEIELMKGRVDDAIRHLKLEVYFATAALGTDHNLTTAGERTLWSLNQLRSPDVALYSLTRLRNNMSFEP
jgi:hypothetical protein